MNTDDVPSPDQLTAHVRTAVDGSVRWLDRALATQPGQLDEWDHANFFARMMLLRGLERGELLGWALQRDAKAASPGDDATALRRTAAYWQEAQPELHMSMDNMRQAADLPPTWHTARNGVSDAREGLFRASHWMEELAIDLAGIQPRPLPMIGRDVSSRAVPPLEVDF